MNLSEYIPSHSWEERSAHIDKTSPCDVDQEVCNSTKRNRGFQALLKLLGLRNDVANRQQADILCLHFCENDSAHGWCTNPLHLGFGTPSENSAMQSPEAARAGSEVNRQNKTGIFDQSVQSQNGKKGGAARVGELNSEMWISLATGLISTAGNVSRHNRCVGADPQARVRISAEDAEQLSRLGASRYKKKPRDPQPAFNTGEVW